MTSSARDQWLDRQFPRAATVREVVVRSGWMHSAGGTGPYLSLRARLPQIDRQDVDDLVYRKLEILELPAVRSSIMLVPREDAGLALAAGRRSFGEQLAKVRVEEKELALLGDRILKVLGKSTRNADGLRSEVPSRMIRNLGEEGKKVGYTTTLPLALRMLQVQGRVLRIAEGFRLDAKSYFYRAWPSSIRIDEVSDLDGALAERFLTWAAPATVDDFAFWAGIGKTAAKKALAAVAAPPAVPSAVPGTVLLPFRDNYVSLHRGLSEFAEGTELLDFGNKPAPIEKLTSLHHNAIVADGELLGIWEFDPQEERIVWRLFRKTAGVEQAVERTERFICEQLGDHRFYAFDRGRTRELRLAFTRR